MARRETPALGVAPPASAARSGEGPVPQPAVTFEEIVRQRTPPAEPQAETNGMGLLPATPSAPGREDDDGADMLERRDADLEAARPRLDELGRVPGSVTVATDSFLKGIVRRLEERG